MTMIKFTFKSQKLRRLNRYTFDYTPEQLGFNISKLTTGQLETSYSHIASDPLEAGDEVIVSYNSGGSFRGWFIGVGKTDKYVCIIWHPDRDYFRIVDVKYVPSKARWTDTINSPGLKVIIPHINTYARNPTKQFVMDISNEEVHHLS